MTEDTTAANTTDAVTTEKQYVSPGLYYDSADFNILVTAPISNGVNPFVFADPQPGALNSTLIIMLRNEQSYFASEYSKKANAAKLQLDRLKYKFGID